MGENMITRDDAIAILQSVVGCGLFSEVITEMLEEIERCIEAEKDGIHIWGAEDDYRELYIAHRSDLITDEMRAKNAKIYEKYAFEPSPFEAEGISDGEDEET